MISSVIHSAKTTFFVASLVVVCFSGIAQSKQDKEKAKEFWSQAIDKMDNEEKYEESIGLLEKAKKLDPTAITYSYEIGFAYYSLKQYEKSIEIVKPFFNHKDVTDRYFQLVGNCYDYLEEPDKAIEVYKQGLKKFPDSGKLYHELGIVFLTQKKYDEAVGYWEEGVKAEPDFSSNYYRLAKIFSATDDRIYAVMYGEIFMNLERNSKRTIEISKLLYDVYKESIDVTSDTSMSVKFASNVISMDVNKKPIFPFSMTFEMIMSASVGINLLAQKEIGMAQLASTRQNFIDMWYKQGKNKDYPNVLFDFHKALIDKGYFEAYNYWILMQGNDNEFAAWHDKNEDDYNKFADWFSDNPMKVTAGNYYVRN